MTLFDDIPDTPDPPDTAHPGLVRAEECARHAAVEGWDRDAATAFILEYLGNCGPTSGEVLVAAATEVYRPHDGRAFGAIFGALSRRGVIRRAGYCNRVLKGHGAPGAVIWELTGEDLDP